VGFQVFDAVFCFAVLMVCIGAAEGDGLAAEMDVVMEYLGVEEAVVGVIMSDSDAVLVSNSFKSALGLKGVFSI